MKRNILNSTLLLLVLSMAMACKTKKVIIGNPAVAAEKPAVNDKKSENLKLLKSKDVVYTTLSLKSKAKLNINGNDNSVNMAIRIKKDEKIWISITAIAGIEVARALITPDSLLVINRLQSVVLKKPFSYVRKFANKQVSFTMLQSILTGNTIADFTNEQATLDLEATGFSIKGEQGDLAFNLLFNTLLKPSVTELNNVTTGQALKVEYADYQLVEAVLFPSVVKVNSVSGKDKISIAFDFSKIERNVQLDFPFTVPKRFETIN